MLQHLWEEGENITEHAGVGLDVRRKCRRLRLEWSNLVVSRFLLEMLSWKFIKTEKCSS